MYATFWYWNGWQLWRGKGDGHLKVLMTYALPNKLLNN